MRVLITGGSGLVGWDLVQKGCQRGCDVTYTYYSNEVTHTNAQGIELNVCDGERVAETIREVQPHVVIHTAALVDVDVCEERPDLARSVNVHGTRNVASVCQDIGCRMVLFSSSFVFSGTQDSYKEDDARNPINVYGQTKVDAEDIISKLSEAIIIRTDQPYAIPEDWQSDTMVSWTLSKLQQNEKVRVFHDWYNNPILLRDLAEITFDLIRSEESGIFHVAGPDFISRYEWAKQIATAFGYSGSRILANSAKDVELEAERPNANLRTEKIDRTVNRKISDTVSGIWTLVNTTGLC